MWWLVWYFVPVVTIVKPMQMIQSFFGGAGHAFDQQKLLIRNLADPSVSMKTFLI